MKTLMIGLLCIIPLLAQDTKASGTVTVNKATFSLDKDATLSIDTTKEISSISCSEPGPMVLIGHGDGSVEIKCPIKKEAKVINCLVTTGCVATVPYISGSSLTYPIEILNRDDKLDIVPISGGKK